MRAAGLAVGTTQGLSGESNPIVIVIVVIIIIVVIIVIMVIVIIVIMVIVIIVIIILQINEALHCWRTYCKSERLNLNSRAVLIRN